MGPGQLVADRFVVERLAGAGGMGAVFKAADRLDGGLVALKVLRAQGAQDAERFSREAEVLAELRHPAIVRYVAHGTTAEGDRYLAMEWLEGESLSERLRRAPLTSAESVGVAATVAEALAVAHRRGIVHRDLKPSNLFVVDRDIARVKIIDFGIARARAKRSLTITGATLGTPGYMAPEQARGDRQIDARADVFALGCVLFKCLTGRAPFVGEDALAVLLKVVLEEAPRASELSRGIPDDLDDLVARMLSKAPPARPADGEEVAAAIAALGAVPSGGGPRSSVVPALGEREQRVMCVVLARGRLGSPDDDTLTTEATGERDRAAAAAASRHGAALARLADGTVVVTISTAEAATDQGARAARCALALRPLLDAPAMALVVGRGVPGERLPMGEIIDLAVRLLGRGGAGVRVNEVAAGLLDVRFTVLGDGAGLYLAAERDVAAARTLLGKPTPCLGRDREIASLLALFEESAGEPLSRAVLVTAPAGVGKSRLRHELVARLGARPDAVEIWLSRGDPMGAGSPFGLLGAAIRRAAGVLDGELPDVRRQKLRGRVGRHVERSRVARVTEFLGELAGVPFPDEQSPELRYARKDPRVLGDQMRRAFEDLLAAECAQHPVLLVLEDLHWGDLPTVSFVDGALRNLADSPFMVLALARPEVLGLFPGLWSGRRVDQIALMPLTRKGSERIVREALGDSVDAETVARVVERAGGNAFYLEELIRSVAAGERDQLPDTVLAMTQVRLEQLDPEARRILRAAAVLGQVFWPGAVRALLGGAERTRELDEWLVELTARELISRRAHAKFPGEEEYAFRSALLREAAYAMLTDEDRALGHRLAAGWLESAGEVEAVVLAEHFELGGQPERAVAFYRRSAEQALGGNDLAAALSRAERGVACGARGGDLGALRLLQAEAHGWRGDNADAERRGVEAMAVLARGGALWLHAASEVATASGRLGHLSALEALGADLLAPDPAAAGSAGLVVALARAVIPALHAGLHELGARLLEAAEGDVSSGSAELAGDPSVLGWLRRAQATRAIYGGDPGAFAELTAASAAEFERAGDLRSACVQRVNAGYAAAELGAYVEAESVLRAALAAAERMGIHNVAGVARNNLGLALARNGSALEGRAVELAAVEGFHAQGEKRLEGGSRIYLSMILSILGDDAGAEREARAAAGVLESSPPSRPYALAVLGDVLLSRGRSAEALAVAAEAMAGLEALGGRMEEGESLLRLVHARALAAAGRAEEARAAAAAARARLLQRAARIASPARRESFLRGVPENASTLELGERLGGPAT